MIITKRDFPLLPFATVHIFSKFMIFLNSRLLTYTCSWCTVHLCLLCSFWSWCWLSYWCTSAPVTLPPICVSPMQLGNKQFWVLREREKEREETMRWILRVGSRTGIEIWFWPWYIPVQCPLRSISVSSESSLMLSEIDDQYPNHFNFFSSLSQV